MLTDFHNFAQLERQLNFQQNPCNISHLTLTHWSYTTLKKLQNKLSQKPGHVHNVMHLQKT